jgi:hypothetical protein
MKPDKQKNKEKNAISNKFRTAGIAAFRPKMKRRVPRHPQHSGAHIAADSSGDP